jgi:hypothetical protein
MLKTAFALCLLACPAVAQTWTSTTFDNGAWFEGRADAPDGTISVRCGGVSPGGQPLPDSDEPFINNPYTLVIVVGGLPAPAEGMGFRDDLALVVGTTGFRLEQAVWDELDGQGWLKEIALTEPLIPALSQSALMAVDSAEGRVAVIPTAGAGLALAQVLQHCIDKWQAANAVPLWLAQPEAAAPVASAPPAPAAATAPAPATAAPAIAGMSEADLKSAVDARVQGLCGDPGQQQSGWLNRADLDGDGTYDFVLDWGANPCQGSGKSPGCSPFSCPIDVFLSSVFTAERGPESLMGKGVRLAPDGKGGLEIVTRESFDCKTARDPGACEFGFAWDGRQVKGVW